MIQDQDEESRDSASESVVSYLPSLRLRADLTNRKCGIEALKVTKRGKLQPRRIALSPNNRTLLVTTTNRIQNIRGLVKYALPQKKDTSAARRIDIGTICRIQKGEQTKRFNLARLRSSRTQKSTSHRMSSANDDKEEKFPLSIVYYNSHHASSSSSSLDIATTETTLDLVIPSREDFNALCLALDDLMRIYRECQAYILPELHLIQYHLISMGREIDDDTKNNIISLSDWSKICQRLNAGISTLQASDLYKEYVSSIGGADAETTENNGMITIPQSLGLLKLVRRNVLSFANLNEDTDEPRYKIWNTVLGNSGNCNSSSIDSAKENCNEIPMEESSVMRNGSSNHDKNIMSAGEFLSFLHFTQKESNLSLDDVKKLFNTLNNHQAVSVTGDGRNGSSVNFSDSGPKSEFITKETFARYLVSDSNELFDPEKARKKNDDSSYMNAPLSQYWINTSHDTYLAHAATTNPVTPGEPGTSYQTELQMYTAALYRGCRCLELDVWDGTIEEKEEPVVRYGLSPSVATTETNGRKLSSSYSKKKLANNGSTSTFLFFSDVLRCVRTFLQSEPDSYPIILSIENHCTTLHQQDKMATHLQSILGNNLFFELHNPSLPSPASLRGKVIVKSKRPLIIKEGCCMVVNDDFDDENDFDDSRKLSSHAQHEGDYYEPLEDIPPTNVIGFNSSGWVLSESPDDTVVEMAPDELLGIAEKDARLAKKIVSEKESKAFELEVLANQAEKRAKDLKEGRKHARDNAQHNVAEVTFPETEDKSPSRVIGIVDDVNQGLEVQDFFADSVEQARLDYDAVNEESVRANELAAAAKADLEEKTSALCVAETSFERATKFRTEGKQSAERALSVARANREHANTYKERVQIVQDILQKRREELSTAETVLNTAKTEAKISEQRALEAEERMIKTQAVAEANLARADKETKREEVIENEAALQLQKLREITQSAKAAKERMEKNTAVLEKIDKQILKLEHSIECIKASKEDSTQTGRSLQKLYTKHKVKVEERAYYSQKLKASSKENVMVEMSREQAQHALDELARKAQQQAHSAASARRKADQSSRAAEQLTEHADEEREASNLRQAACKKAEESVRQSEANCSSVEAQLAEAVRAADEAANLAKNSRQNAEKLAAEAEQIGDTKGYREEIECMKKEKALALTTFQKANLEKEKVDNKLADSKRLLDTSTEVLFNAEKEAAAEERRINAERKSEQDVIDAQKYATEMKQKAEKAKAEANTAVADATNKAAALNHARMYKEKAARVNVVSTKLARMTLLHSVKFKNFEKSISLPCSHTHSISESKLLQIAKSGKTEWKSLVGFTRNHLARTFPSKYVNRSSSKNHNPILPWAMGCQLVSMNFQAFDEHLFLNDGRFRENGSCGYVRKPDALIKGGVGVFNNELSFPRKWTIRVLSGYFIPQPDKLATRKVAGMKCNAISPMVRLSLYDGDPDAVSSPTIHETHPVHQNGLNPVWNEITGTTFVVFSPAVAILLITVLDGTVNDCDNFLAAAAVPIACLREGYRRVSLYDANHTRSGAYQFSSLLVNVDREY